MASFKRSLKSINLKQEDLNDLLSKMNEIIKQVQIEIKKYKCELLMNEGIYFEKDEKDSSFGQISTYSCKFNLLSTNCGELIRVYEENFYCVNIIQVDEK